MGKGSARTSCTRDGYDATREDDVRKTAESKLDIADLEASTPSIVVVDAAKREEPTTSPPPSSDIPPLQNNLLRNASPSFSPREGEEKDDDDDDDDDDDGGGGGGGGGDDDNDARRRAGGRRSSDDDDDDVDNDDDDDERAGTVSKHYYDAAFDEAPGPPATLHLEYWMRSEVRCIMLHNGMNGCCRTCCLPFSYRIATSQQSIPATPPRTPCRAPLPPVFPPFPFLSDDLPYKTNTNNETCPLASTRLDPTTNY